MASEDTVEQEFYAPWPNFGKPLNQQWGEIRHDTAVLAPLVRGIGLDASGDFSTLDSKEQTAMQAFELGEQDFHNKIRHHWNKTTDTLEIQANIPPGTSNTPHWYTVWSVGKDGQVTQQTTPTTASNVGGGSELFKQKSGVDLEFRTLTATSPITLTQNANTVDVDGSALVSTYSSDQAAAPSGDANVGVEIILSDTGKVGNDLPFKALKAGPNVVIRNTGTAIEIESTAQVVEFYGIAVMYDDVSTVYPEVHNFKVNRNHFYLTQKKTNPSEKEVNLNLRGDVFDANAYVEVAGDTMLGALLHPDGSAGAPSISFSGDTNTGLYRNAADDLAMVAGGTAVLRALADRVFFPQQVQLASSGDVSAPDLMFFTNTTTGLYQKVANDDSIAFATGGVEAGYFDTNQDLYVTNEVLVADDAYAASWDSDLSVPTKNALYDKITAMDIQIEAGAGFYALTIRESGPGRIFQSDAVTFDVAGFYVSIGGDGKPLVSPKTTIIREDTHQGLVNLNNLNDGGLGTDEALGMTVASDGATITLTITNAGVGKAATAPLNVQFEGQNYTYTPSGGAETLTLTAGTATVPIENFVVFELINGVPTLVKSTTDWPQDAAGAADSHARICAIVVQDAGNVQTHGVLKIHAWTDHPVELHNSGSGERGERGHLHTIAERLRNEPAIWRSGSAITVDNSGTTDPLYVHITSGTGYQMHRHSSPALDTDGSDSIWVVNDDTTPYTKIDSLDDLTRFATGGEGAIGVSEKFTVVLWMVVNENSGDTKLFLNVPTGGYNTVSAAETDSSNKRVHNVPQAYVGTSILLYELVLGRSGGGSTWTVHNTIDLRGVPGVAIGGGGAATTGEVNTASNVGAGAGVFAQKTSVDLQFKSLKAYDEAISITNDSDQIFIGATGSFYTNVTIEKTGASLLVGDGAAGDSIIEFYDEKTLAYTMGFDDSETAWKLTSGPMDNTNDEIVVTPDLVTINKLAGGDIIAGTGKFYTSLSADEFLAMRQGSTAACSFAWVDDPNTGLYLDGIGDPRLVVNGVGMTAWQSTGMIPLAAVRHNVAGSVGVPSYTWHNDSDTGLFQNSSGDNSIAFTTGGTRAAYLDSDQTLHVLNDVNSSRVEAGIGEFYTSILVDGALTLIRGEITDSSGTISFGDEDLTTTGSITSTSGMTADTLEMAGGSIVDSSGQISFGGNNVIGIGTLASGTHTIGTLVLAAGSITDTSTAISFGNENLSTTGTLASGNLTVTGTGAFSGLITQTLGTQNFIAGTGAGNGGLGNDCVFLGFNAGNANTASGDRNVFVGSGAGDVNTDGFDNIFIGESAGGANLTTDHNVFIGTGAGRNNIASQNVYIGHEAGELGNNATAKENVFIGFRAGEANLTGADSVMIGWTAGQKATAGANVYIGAKAGDVQTTGNNNVYVGLNAGGSATTGNSSVYIGAGAAFGNTGGTLNTVVGRSAGSAAGATFTGATLFGYNAGKSITTGAGNLCFGLSAGQATTIGISNTFIGSNAGFTNIDGDLNIVIGRDAGFFNVSGDRNLCFGFESGKANTSSDNMMMGYQSGLVTVGGGTNLFIGNYTGLANTSGAGNIYIGFSAGRYQTTESDQFILDNKDQGSKAAELTDALMFGTFHATPSSQTLTINAGVTVTQHLIGTPDEITATSEGVAASLLTINTEVRTNGDSDEDNVTLANGASGQIKHIYCVAVGNAADSYKITPATFVQGTDITFYAARSPTGKGCTLVYADNEGWTVVGNNGGAIT